MCIQACARVPNKNFYVLFKLLFPQCKLYRNIFSNVDMNYKDFTHQINKFILTVKEIDIDWKIYKLEIFFDLDYF